MEDLIRKIVNNKGKNYFEFNNNNENPVKYLKEQTKSVPNTAGLYLVFTKKNNNEFKHLNFEIENDLHQLLYFGKAGGLTKKGKSIRQGLNGRINNVISDSKLNLKDVKRAIYWERIMNEFKFNKLTIIYFEDKNPQELENKIYSFLDKEEKRYPLMNKKRGR
jgi:hypothetical protein